MIERIIFLVCSYLIGAIPVAFIVTKLVRGIDIRTCGSGNVGATNVFRSVGKRWGIFVFICDIVKGVLAVTVWRNIAAAAGADPVSMRFLFACGVAAVAGHNWPVFLKFKGGKGVSTTLGVLLGLFPLSVTITTLIAFTIIGITRYVSVGSMSGAVLFPVVFFFTHRGMEDFRFFMTVIIAVALLIVIKHRSNIKRLLHGEENKVF